jgi:hypothetical protein
MRWSRENVCWLDISVDDSLSVGGSESIGNLNSQVQHTLDRQRLLSHPVRRCRKSCKCLGDLMPRRHGPRDGSVQVRLSRQAFRRAGISDPQPDGAECLRPCTQRPYLRRRVSRLCGNGKWFGRSVRRSPPLGAHIRCRLKLKSTDQQVSQRAICAKRHSEVKATHKLRKSSTSGL